MKDYTKIIGSPKIFSFTVMWMIILVFIGTVVQKDIGLYAAQTQYFSSWFSWFWFLPLPSGKLTMLVMFINLSCYFFRPNIFSNKKIGITTTHLGVILMLVGGALTSFFSNEGSIVIDEGKISNYYENYYNKELIVVNTSQPDSDYFTVFKSPLLIKDKILLHESIPFKIEILDYFVNCKPISRIYEGQNELKGMAKNFFLQQLPIEKEYEKNISGIIYKLSNSESSDGVYMNYIGQPITQTLHNNNKDYMLILRRERTYLPFELELIDFEKVMYPGTEVPKSYSSLVNLVENNISRKVLISMNEPLRYRGYTFYQASFIENGLKQTTVLATVENHGRLFPYISTIIMCIGILYHMLFIVSKRFYRKEN
jgi:hypothetical protein